MIRKLQGLVLMLGAVMLLAHAPAFADRTPDWMVGRFETDVRNGKMISLRVSSQGSMTATLRQEGDRTIDVGASFRRDILTIDDRDYTVVRSSDGFRAVPDRTRRNQGNARNRDDNDRFAQIVFHHVDDPIDSRQGNGRDDRISGERPPDWFVGRFDGINPRDNQTITLMTDRQGNIAASSRNGRRSTAYTTAPLHRGIMTVDGIDYRVTQTRTGFTASPTNDRGNRRSADIDFRRVGDALDSRQNRRDATRPPDWMVGTFEGYSRRDGQTLTLRATRQGGVTAAIKGSRRNSDRISSSFDRDVLTIGDTDYTVERTTDGFRAIPVEDRSNPRTDRASRASQISFRRTGD